MVDTSSLYQYGPAIIKSLFILIAGYIASKMLSSVSGTLLKKKFGDHIARVSRKVVFYLLISVTLITFLGEFINLTAVIAAAGILGVAIGFASQKSVSNIISGFFLMADNPFEIGDAVEVDGQGGFVLDIGLLSTRMRTFDNRYLRIPNEEMSSAKIINFTKYDIRRIDLPIGIAYKEELAEAVEVVANAVKANNFVLMEPEPIVLVTGYGDSSMNL
ncbi:mechanosensitive ion channel family protein, partial [archaeon]|nr:mechanosensitive ion channel family protein [archaeon]